VGHDGGVAGVFVFNDKPAAADSCNFLAPTGSLATDNAGFYFSKSQTTAGTCDRRPKI
jgi:hypothetical protein